MIILNSKSHFPTRCMVRITCSSSSPRRLCHHHHHHLRFHQCNRQKCSRWFGGVERRTVWACWSYSHSYHIYWLAWIPHSFHFPIHAPLQEVWQNEMVFVDGHWISSSQIEQYRHGTSTRERSRHRGGAQVRAKAAWIMRLFPHLKYLPISPNKYL